MQKICLHDYKKSSTAEFFLKMGHSSKVLVVVFDVVVVRVVVDSGDCGIGDDIMMVMVF